MKIKEEQPRELCDYSNRVGGRVQFWFTKKELPLVFEEINDYIDVLNKRYTQCQLTYNFSWHYNSADLFWWRPLTEEEKLKVKELKKRSRNEFKKRDRIRVMKLAKKYGLIK